MAVSHDLELCTMDSTIFSSNIWILNYLNLDAQLSWLCSYLLLFKINSVELPKYMFSCLYCEPMRANCTAKPVCFHRIMCYMIWPSTDIFAIYILLLPCLFFRPISSYFCLVLPWYKGLCLALLQLVMLWSVCWYLWEVCSFLMGKGRWGMDLGERWGAC